MAKTELLLGGYAARTCPVATQLDFDSKADGKEAVKSEAQQLRIDAGNEFEASVFQRLIELHGDRVTRINTGGKAGDQQATVGALMSEATIILGGYLPDDREAMRSGRPDILLRYGGGWIPIDVKHHGVVTDDEKKQEQFVKLEDLLNPSPETSTETGPSTHALEDVLQLSHYWRMLESLGWAANEPRGAIIDSDGRAWWFELDQPRWSTPKSSALARYDKEFALRANVAKNQVKLNSDNSLQPLVIPIWKGECANCKWIDVCKTELEEEDSLTFLPTTRVSSSLTLIHNGVVSRHDVAELDWQTARLMHGDSSKSANVDVGEILNAAELCSGDDDLVKILGKRKTARLQRLGEMGFTKVSDLGVLDRRTAGLPTKGIGYLPRLIDEARAFVDGQAYLARGLEKVSIVRADVEVDVDMESSDDGVYMWGTLLSRRGDTLPPEYRAFVTWDSLTDQSEAELLLEFWTWLQQLRSETEGAGQSFAAYFYSDAENKEMRRIAKHSTSGPDISAVEEFIAEKDLWIDLLKIVKNQVVTGTGRGLKKIAQMAEFEWRDGDPGGEQSTVWYEVATKSSDEEERNASRQRLLEYNEDDVLATQATREWLETIRSTLPSSIEA